MANILPRLVLGGSILAVSGGGVTALEAPRPPAAVPVPQARTAAPVQKAMVPRAQPAASRSDTITTGSLTRVAAPGTPATLSALEDGLEALRHDRYTEARAIRDAMPAASLDRDVLTWALAYFGDKNLPSNEIAAAAQRLSDWPGMARLRENSERALASENPSTKTVLAAFGNTSPQTWEGAAVLARAHMANGDTKAARAVLAPFWRETKLDAAEETAAIKTFGTLLTRADHRHRMEYMLYESRVRSAERVAGLAGAKELANAWGAVIRRKGNAGALLDAVPKGQRSAGYIFAKAHYLRSREKFRDAAKIINQAPRERAALIDPDQWWLERRVLSRELLDQGDRQLAYQVAAHHAAESPAKAAEAEFHAGWYALRAIGDAKTAHRHFARILDIADGPISRARAYYWLGRAAQAGAEGSSRDYYGKAAQYGTAFYGQLAAAKIGQSSVSVPYPKPSQADRDRFAQRRSVAAIGRLEQAGHGWRANVLYQQLAEELTSVGELALLAVMAENSGNHRMALKIGKAAAARGLDVGALSHPLGAIPAAANISGAGKALAYAIARQESEFHAGAVSPAGARGLLQLMPGTAKAVARRSGLGYSQQRLTSDPAYNATLGSQFLKEQLERFNGSYVLTFAAYNAGPNRAQQWIERYGDPRGKSVEEVVDWVERIPYTETRSYVQRVMENYQVYKMRLTGRIDIESDLRHGR